MSDMPCVYEMNMIHENAQMEQDLMSGRGLDVLFCLMDDLSSRELIARRLGMPVFSVQLYLNRMVKAGLVREETRVVRNGEIKKEYFLISNEINIINRLNASITPGDKRKNEIAAHHFAMMVRNAIKNAGENAQQPNRIKAYFMKAKESDMTAFKKEINQLFEKFQTLEDLDETNLYSLFTVLSPYEMEDSKK